MAKKFATIRTLRSGRNVRARRTRRAPSRSGATVAGISSASPLVNIGRYSQRQTAMVPFPLSFKAKLTYGVNVALGTAGSVNTATAYHFRLNSCYDPDLTGTGNQPYQYDQMTAIYTKYWVKACYVDITFCDPSADGLWMGWCVRTDTTTNDSPSGKLLEDLISRPTFTCVPVSNTGSQTYNLRMNVPLHLVFGVSAASYAVRDLYGAAYNANPLTNALLSLFMVDPNALITQNYIRAVGRLVFDVEFFDYAAPTAS